MNISPENIDKYKQDMMRLYRSVSPAQAQAAAQATTAPAPETQNHGTPAYIPDTGYIEAPNFPGIPDTGPIEAPTPQPPAEGIQVPDTGYIEAPGSGIQVPDTGYIEVPPGVTSPSLRPGEAMGYLRTQVYASNRAIPIEGALILITEFTDDGRTNLIRMLVTDESGYTETIPLPVPVYDLDHYPSPSDKPFRDYRMSVYKEGYYIVPDVKIPIFAGVKSLQPIQMVPLRENEERVNILPKEFADTVRARNTANADGTVISNAVNNNVG